MTTIELIAGKPPSGSRPAADRIGESASRTEGISPRHGRAYLPLLFPIGSAVAIVFSTSAVSPFRVGPRFCEQMLLDLADSWKDTCPWPLVADRYKPFESEIAGQIQNGLP